MNRQILFKAKDKYNGEWVEGLPGYDLNGNITELEVYISFGNFLIHDIDPDTLCQYTSLTDKNDRKIWENDIVEIASEDGYFLCEWDDDAARYVLNGYGLTVDSDNYWAYEVEVVGNNFDNADLLE